MNCEHSLNFISFSTLISRILTIDPLTELLTLAGGSVSISTNKGIYSSVNDTSADTQQL